MKNHVQISKFVFKIVYLLKVVHCRASRWHWQLKKKILKKHFGHLYQEMRNNQSPIFQKKLPKPSKSHQNARFSSHFRPNFQFFDLGFFFQGCGKDDGAVAGCIENCETCWKQMTNKIEYFHVFSFKTVTMTRISYIFS